MHINAIEITNIIILLVCLVAILKKNDTTSLLFILFIYAALHFSYAIFAFATESPGLYIEHLHVEGGGVLARTSALLLIGTVFVLLFRKAISSWKIKFKSNLKVEFYFISIMVFIFLGYIFNIRHDDWMQFKNVLSIEAMFAILLVGFGASNDGTDRNFNISYHQILSILVILVIADSIAIYEIFSQQSWAITNHYTRVNIYRASSILFNPNLFSFWSVLLYLGFAYGFHVRKEQQSMMIWGMILTSVAIYFTGSRSSGYLLLGALFLPVLLLKGRKHLIPLIILPISMLIIYIVVFWFIEPLNTSYKGWHNIVLLGERFVTILLDLSNYTISILGLSDVIPNSLNVEVSPRVLESIEGRLTGKGVDSGWIVIYQDIGWLGLAAMLSFFIIFLFKGLRAYYITKTVTSVYALSILFCCFLIGFVLRLQVFPVWLFVAVVLSPCLLYWNRTDTLKRGVIN